MHVTVHPLFFWHQESNWTFLLKELRKEAETAKKKALKK
jgi:hypothetical protein